MEEIFWLFIIPAIICILASYMLCNLIAGDTPFIDQNFVKQNTLYYCKHPCETYYRRYQEADGLCPNCNTTCGSRVHDHYPWMDKAPEFKKLNYLEYLQLKKERKNVENQQHELKGIELYHNYVAKKDWYGEKGSVLIGNRHYTSVSEARSHSLELETFFNAAQQSND